MRNFTCLVAIQTLLLAACTTTGVSETQSLGRIVSTVGKPVPDGVHPAYVYEIDGQRVSHHKPVHRLVPGSHTIRVSPYIEGPQYLLNVPHHEKRAVRNEQLILSVKPGEAYYIAAQVDTRQTANNGYKAEWRPIVVRTVIF